MSGICGFIHLDGRPADPADLARMTSLLERRGPEGTGHWHEGPVALGHTLLATTPESLNETLPYRHPETGCVITADVRLDNRPELLEALGARQRLAEAGDGTLLLEAYLRWGEACVDHFLGDFAFAIWDPRHRRLFCARDHMGMRQLIYHHTPGSLFAFATEPQAVLQVDGVPRKLNEVRIADYFSDLEYYDITSTLFEEIYRLQPAHFLRVEACRLECRRYWTLTPRSRLELPSDEAYAEAFLEVFTEAVRCRLRTPPGRLGSMLSGGMDSSSVVAVASQLLGEAGQGPLRTFSGVGPNPESCIETRTLRETMTLPGLMSEVVDHEYLGPWKDDLLRVAHQLDEPFDVHTSLLRAVYLAAHRAGVTVVLDGVAGDGVLNHGTQIARLLRTGRWTQAVRDAVGAQLFWGPSTPAWRTLVQSARTAFAPPWLRRVTRWARSHRAGSGTTDDGLINPAFARRIDLAGRKASLLWPPVQGWPSHAEERARSIASPTLQIARERYDRVAAALAIEPRDPFMDLRMLELSLRLPGAQLERNGWPKIILRRAMVGRLPDTVRWRRGKEHLGLAFTRSVFSHRAIRRNVEFGRYALLRAYVAEEHVIASLHGGIARVRELQRLGSPLDDRALQTIAISGFIDWMIGVQPLVELGEGRASDRRE